ncbi:unnamed protein product [Allacma fusca]|uniref:Protein arginine methyltransferase NDUFAF7 n=1 Tax=Allacma fusca TaxID=39272 RepID=A0A8J2LK96_9HEXA|nr:unnamed protein product [Allacma fusca]
MSQQLVRSIYDQIKSRILVSGPIPVADYMKMALTNSGIILPPDKSQGTAKREIDAGYYMKKDVFGPSGDFVTSPEISQMFGEMIGIWGIQTWLQIGGPKKFNIVELGPGRGSLAKDMLRVFKRFERLIGSDVSLHLVEISPFMANLQEETLCEKKKNYLDYITRRSESNWIDPAKVLPHQSYYHKAISKDTNYPIYWYRDVQSIPNEFNFYIAHEFFDALPIHKLQKVDDHQWREILVDIDPLALPDTEKLRFVLSRHETPVIKILERFQDKLLQDHRQHIEISLETITVLDEMTSRIDRDGGIALVIDYGHDGTKEDTFRGFYKHKLHDPLLKPGTADLTADVDFSFVRKFCWDKAWVLGPTSQRDFLKSVGIEVRYNKLVAQCKTDTEKLVLQSGYRMLIDDMGERFKFMGIFPKILENYKPGLKIVGFHE